VTAGEHIMNGLKDHFLFENWMWLTFGKAVKEAQGHSTGNQADLYIPATSKRHEFNI